MGAFFSQCQCSYSNADAVIDSHDVEFWASLIAGCSTGVLCCAMLPRLINNTNLTIKALVGFGVAMFPLLLLSANKASADAECKCRCRCGVQVQVQMRSAMKSPCSIC